MQTTRQSSSYTTLVNERWCDVDMDEWVRQLQANLDEGLLGHFYDTVSVQPGDVFSTLREAGIKVYSVTDVQGVPTEVLDPVVDKLIRRTTWRGTFYGATFGLGGMLSIPPELGYVLVTMIRLAQQVSLCYGQEYDTQRGRIELWSALGRSMGIDLDLEGLESELYRKLPVVFGTGPFRDPLMLKLAQKVLVTVGVRLSTRAARFIPLVGAGVGVVTTYTYLANLGKHLKEEYRARHQLLHLKLDEEGFSEEIPYTMRKEDRG